MSKMHVNIKKIAAIFASFVMLNSCGRALRRYVSEPECDTNLIASDKSNVSVAVKEVKVIDNVEIINVDTKTHENVSGAVIDIRNSEGQIIREFITTENPYYDYLKPGNYTIEEPNHALGYKTSTELVSFTVLEEGMTKVVFYDTPKEKVKTK